MQAMETLSQSSRRPPAQAAGWQFWVDRGGTFTDVIGLSPAGELHVRKVPSASAGGAADDPGLRAVRAILAAAGAAPRAVAAVKVGTTVATNALLTRSGAPVVLVTSAGFADALRIGYQNRPDIFARDIVLPEPLYGTVIEAHERIDARGAVLTPLDGARLRADLTRARRAGARAVAIVFLHGWRHPQHEQEAASCARSLGFEEVSVSHELSPLVRYVSRGDTTVLNAYLAPPLRSYVGALHEQLRALDPQVRLTLMQSNGGLAAAESFHAMSSVLSGPAGGLIGMHWVGERLGERRLIGFDMGGTSTDVSLVDGELPQRFEHLIAGARLNQPMLDVHSIAAGGGSILSYHDGRFAVGPASAGADPGPVCYGRGGPLTLTDVQVLLGHLRTDTLPAVFGPEGRSPIDAQKVTAAFATLARELREPGAQPCPLEMLAESFLEVGVEAMANAIRRVATRQGRDAGEFTLFCFGGAAGQHACRVARAAGARRILVHPLASVLAAFGIGVADRLAVRRASLRRPLDEAGLAAARTALDELESEARAELTPGGADRAQVRIARLLEVRAGDSDVALSVPLGRLGELREAFHAEHLRRFGFTARALEAVIESLRVEARLASVDAATLVMPEPAAPGELPQRVRAWFGGWREVPLGSMGASVRAVIAARRGRLEPGDSWLLNSPYHGGTHLPDMTVVTPVFVGARARPRFFVASRAHHADIGGMTPGSMPPFSRTIEEEGALFECFALVRGGKLRESGLRAALAAGPWPARKPDQNVADLRAQLAANARGIAEIERAVRRHGLDAMCAYMRLVQDNAAHSVRNAIGRLQPGSFRYPMDDGQLIAVRVDIDHERRRARVDFTGTSPEGAHNFNAPRAVCTAAVLYVFRTLIERPIPLNEGCLEPLELVIPPGSLLDPRPPAAVAAGNVETSQCIVDALYGALGILAASQGTMNNLTFGDERLQYYETIAGGAGAGADFDGCDAVQTHRTSSRLTDPEILESTFPVLVREFAIRRGSGGAGRHRGGDGIVRRLEFRARFSGALLANHRRVAPFGLFGGEPGERGEAFIRRADGTVERLGPTARFEVGPGDELTILTPGGGGFGSPDRAPPP